MTGRPTDYKEEYDVQAYKLCLLGSTDKSLADFFEVVESTINLWKLKHPTFSESIKSGKKEADSNVAESLYNRATGYSHEEEKIFNNNGDIIRATTTKHYPPDATSAIFWLKNRDKKNWRDKQEIDQTVKVDKLDELLSELTNTRLPPSER